MPAVPLLAPAWRSAASRWVVLGALVALVATAISVPRPTDAATALEQRISSTRSGQKYTESQMRSADSTVRAMKSAKRSAKRALKATRRSLRRTKQRRARARVSADAAKRAYLDAYRARREAEKDGTPHTVTKQQVVRLRARMKSKRQSYRAIDRWVGRIQVARNSHRRRYAYSRRQLTAARRRREVAEAILRGMIANMTQLARERVANKVGTELSAGPVTFTWPTAGRISGGFGCTTARFYPRRGSCAHFHDGIDIANVAGTPIHAMADGVVAFVGWNPSDERGRAFIVVIAHPNGYVSRYGHMLPIRRVRAGQVVRKGELIARMGNTGFSFGSHLHVEIQAGSTTLNPASFLPARAAAGSVTGADISRPKERKAERRKANERKRAARRAKAREAARARRARAQRLGERATDAAMEAFCAHDAAAAALGDGADPPAQGPTSTLAADVLAPPEARPLAARPDGPVDTCDPDPASTDPDRVQSEPIATAPRAASTAQPSSPSADRAVGPLVRMRATSPRPQ